MRQATCATSRNRIGLTIDYYTDFFQELLQEKDEYKQICFETKPEVFCQQNTSGTTSEGIEAFSVPYSTMLIPKRPLAQRLQSPIQTGNHSHSTNTSTDYMKRSLFIALTLVAFSTTAFAQANKATQQVSINVAEIAAISVTGTVAMVINAATAGQAPDAAFSTVSYSVSTNGTDKKISAELDTAMPTGLTLNATMAAPTGASSAGKLSLSKTSKDLVSGITKVRGTGLALNYEAVATVEASPDSYVRTVTYTITNN